LKLAWKAATLPIKAEFTGWYREDKIRAIQEGHAAANPPITDVLPAPHNKALGANHVAIDIPGTELTVINCKHPYFLDNLNQLTPGLALVTIRVQPDSSGQLSMGAFVQGHHVGWFPQRYNAISHRRNDFVQFKKLNKAGYLIRSTVPQPPS
jgi:hypothetical protein